MAETEAMSASKHIDESGQFKPALEEITRAQGHYKWQTVETEPAPAAEPASPHNTGYRKTAKQADAETEVSCSHDVLATHSVVATFQGLNTRESMARMYPPPPPVTWAEFRVDSYTFFDKPGQYGDEKKQQLAFQPEVQSRW